MKNFLLKLAYASSLITLSFGLAGCPHNSHSKHDHGKPNVIVNGDVKTSFAEVDLSKSAPVVIEPSLTSTISAVSVIDTNGASYRDDYQTWQLDSTNGAGVQFQLNLTHPTMTQLSMKNAFVLNTGSEMSSVNITINGQLLNDQALQVTNAQWHETILNIPASMLNSGPNEISFSLNPSSAWWFLQDVKIIPQKLFSENGELTTTLFSQFGLNQNLSGVYTNLLGAPDPAECGQDGCYIWTRAYGLDSTTEMTPGPTLYYNPGDLLTVNLVNKMDGDALNQFEQGQSESLGTDEVLANLDDKIRQEVNIPHNLNNTNLHVHGLHVDPSKDDVTIVIVPEDEAGTVDEYDAPHHLPETPADLAGLNEGDVSDQPVKPGRWEYQYRIPENHLPGTHWFHPHKHGSTAAQLENGMAGSMVILEPEELAVFPGQQNTDWSNRHDEVMVIQQISNFGHQKGAGTGNGTQAAANAKAPVTVVNGTHIPQKNLAAGQILRWRFVNAGANHRAFNHFWMGKNTGLTIGPNDQPVYVSHPIYSVAFDGITVPEKAVSTAETPFLLAPGNRADIVFQIPASSENGAEFELFKYYPTDISIVDPSFFTDNAPVSELENYLSWNCSDPNQTAKKTCNYGSIGPLEPAFAPHSNLYLFDPNNDFAQPTNGMTYPANFTGDNVVWMGTDNKTPQTPITPLIKVEDNNGMLDLNFALKTEFPTGPCPTGQDCSGKWQPQLDAFGGGSVIAEKLVSITVDTSLSPIGPTALPTDSYLSSISPAGTFSQGKTAPGFSGAIPPYVSPIGTNDILQSRPIIFDKSGVAITVTSTDGSKTQGVNQFTLNGRPFALNDMLGNSTQNVNDRLADGVTWSELKSVPTGDSTSTSAPDSGQCTETSDSSCLDIQEKLTFTSSGKSVWTNGVCTSPPCEDNGPTADTETTFYWANPSYYQNIDYDNATSSYKYAEANIAPDWTDISGLDAPAVVNPSNKYGAISGNVNGVPGLPVATTAEEWYLINNSDIGHPFHIHINPFFVLEVGQLSYEQFADGNEWVMTAVTADGFPQHSPLDTSGNAPTTPSIYNSNSDVDHVVGNWWDTIIVPPHGYVKVRYWMNVPNQTGEDANAIVTDDFNKIGVWVYHCHILRHEDRGMMMPIITQQKTTSSAN